MADNFALPFRELEAIDIFAPTDRERITYSAGAGQRARRATALAQTRRLICQDGWEGARIRDIAELSGVSVQTLYNQFGGRQALFEMAMCEDVPRMALHATQLKSAANAVEAFADVSCYYVYRWPRYVEEVLRFNSPLHSSYPIVQAMRVNAASALLHSMKPTHVMASDTNVRELASNVTLLMVVTMTEWIGGLHSFAAFCTEMRARTEHLVRASFHPKMAA